MKKAVIVLMLCLSTLVCFGEIYRSMDSEGTVVLSDVPHKGGSKISPAKTQTYAPALPKNKSDQLVIPSGDQAKRDKIPYQLVAILKPSQNETLRSQVVTVLVDVKPSLFKGDRIELYMDGHKVVSSDKSYHFSIHNVERGTHVIRAKVFNVAGDEVGSSADVIIHVQLPRISQKLRRPPPKAVSDALARRISLNRSKSYQANINA